MQEFKYTHIIWDWNGTLFDDAWLCVEVMNSLLTRRDLPKITPARHETIFDFPVIDYYRKLEFDFAREPFEQISSEFIHNYKSRMKECHLRDQALLALSAAEPLGITQSILSAMKQDMLSDMIDHFGLRRYFTDVVGIADHHAAGKTEVAKRWMSRSRLNQNAVLFVGDTTHDHAVAQSLGVDCCVIYSGHHSRNRLSATGMRLIDSLIDVYE